MVLLRRLALAAALLQPADAAERVKFDFNWRFFLGEPDGPGDGSCNATAFHSTGNAICGKLKAVPAAKGVEACVAACCSMGPTCEVWQLSDDPEEPHGADCWIGTCDPARPLHNMTRGGWQGGARAAPAPAPGPVPPATTGPASVGYDDSAWSA